MKSIRQFFSKRHNSTSFKASWQKLYSDNLESFDRILKRELTWTSWDRNLMPASSAEDRFLTAIEILSGSDDWELARRYAERSLEIIDRIIREDRLSELIDFPRNRGQMNRTKVYAQSLLGQPWDSELLRSASKDFESDCRDNYPKATDWSSQVQFYYLDSVNMALLGDDIEGAARLLGSAPYPLKNHAEHTSLLSDLIRWIRADMTENERAEFSSAYEAFFNRVRDPHYQSPAFMEIVGELDVALIREKYIEHPGEEIDWQRVIEDFSR